MGRDITANFGPPGTGKTTYLCQEVLPSFSESERTAVVSFSRAAAKKLTEGLRPSPARYVGTLHALCFRELGLSRSDVATVEGFYHETGIDSIQAQIVVDVDSLARNLRIEHEVAHDRTLFSHSDILPYSTFNYYLGVYRDWKVKNALLDFSDMLEMAIKGRVLLEGGWKSVVVDEAQDLTPLQWLTVESMLADRVVLAGDDDQSIYTFNGADPIIMSRVATKKNVLAQSHRCPAEIQELALAVAAKIQTRESKTWKPRRGKGKLEFVGSYGSIFDGLPHGHVVLVRDRWRKSEYTEFLSSMSVPYQVTGGRSPLNTKAASAIRAVMKKDYDAADDLLKWMQPAMALKVEARKLTGKEKAEEVINWERVDYEDGNYLCNVDLFDDRVVTVSTIHGFKGEEAECIVLDCECTPMVENAQYSEQDMDNELRVWYTGVTRARESLYVIGTNNFIG